MGLSFTLAALACTFYAGSCVKAQNGPRIPQALKLKVVATHPHDRGAFTQGLVWWQGRLFESTGQYGDSSLRRVDLRTGTVEQQVDLPDDVFGEGLALVERRLIQLSWRNGRAFVWDAATLEPKGELAYAGEGWGLCHDGKRLVMSDGTDKLTFREPATFAKVGEVSVTKAGMPVGNLNELECVDGHVFANVWMHEHIARIDPRTGEVTAWVDASGLLSPAERMGTDVLNGIAYVPETGRFLLTGKYWPAVFEVELVPGG